MDKAEYFSQPLTEDPVEPGILVVVDSTKFIQNAIVYLLADDLETKELSIGQVLSTTSVSVKEIKQYSYGVGDLSLYTLDKNPVLVQPEQSVYGVVVPSSSQGFGTTEPLQVGDFGIISSGQIITNGELQAGSISTSSALLSDSLFMLPGSTATVSNLVITGKVRSNPIGNSVASPGDATLNAITGKSQIAATFDNITITNNLVTNTSFVSAWIQQPIPDATLTHVVRTSVSNGSFKVYGNDVATDNVTICWEVKN